MKSSHWLMTAIVASALCSGAVCAKEHKAKPAATKPAAAKPAAAQPASPVTGKYDTKLPVEISSDTLEVLQRENKAIFKGSVVAVQGKLRLTSDVMIVHYQQKGNKPAAAAPTGSGDMGAITLIEVQGHVMMTTPEETAEGDKGDYDVEKRFLRLTGDEVILTREKNILRGKSIDYNLDTGHSVLTNGEGNAAKGSDTRVRGVFVPKEEPKK